LPRWKVLSRLRSRRRHWVRPWTDLIRPRCRHHPLLRWTDTIPPLSRRRLWVRLTARIRARCRPPR
jgi:hypothetical protein